MSSTKVHVVPAVEATSMALSKRGMSLRPGAPAAIAVVKIVEVVEAARRVVLPTRKVPVLLV